MMFKVLVSAPLSHQVYSMANVVVFLHDVFSKQIDINSDLFCCGILSHVLTCKGHTLPI
jgi:hypothetical protein